MSNSLDPDQGQCLGPNGVWLSGFFCARLEIEVEASIVRASAEAQYCAMSLSKTLCHCLILGAQWLSGRVLDSRPKGSGFEPHRRHCAVVLEQDTFILA